MKKFILLLCVILGAALVFTSCGGNDSSNPTSGVLDGTWIASETMDQSGQTFPVMKVVISGSNCSLSELDFAASMEAGDFVWGTPVSGTFTRSGNTITASFPGNSFNGVQLTLSDDGTTMTLPATEPLVFVKQ